ncbi:MAG: hypothetical protein IPJ34_13080 [Myxococcales bacterium]|nr:hypothetical protein [Myxococcales bacterium]
MTTPSVSALGERLGERVSAKASRRSPLPSVAPSEGVGVVLGPEGHLGAGLALGPFRLDDKKADVATFRPTGVVDDRASLPRYGATEGSARVDVAQKVYARALAGRRPRPRGARPSGDGPVDLGSARRAHPRQALHRSSSARRCGS